MTDPSYPSQDPQPTSQTETCHENARERLDVRPERVVESELLSDNISHGDLQQFSDAMGKSVGQHCTHTLGWLDFSLIPQLIYYPLSFFSKGWSTPP